MTRDTLKTGIIAAASLLALTGLAATPAFAAGPEKAAMVETMDDTAMMKDEMAKDAMMKDSMMKDTAMVGAPAPLIRVNKTLKGSVQVVKSADGSAMIRLSDDFRASNGPDLKIFLNPKSVGDVTGRTATMNAVLLGELKANRGTQDYTIPAGIDLAEYGSVLVHCEQFSVLWGGANI